MGRWEIEEEAISSDDEMVYNRLESIREESSVVSRGEDDVYYVVIWGKHNDETTSMDALLWTLNLIPNSNSSLVYLLHIFPQIKFIPSPLGNLPVNQVNPEQKEIYMSQERGKRRDFLQKFLNVSSSSQVKVDTILIESEMEAKAILDLIPILNIKKLVIGVTKSTVRRIQGRKGNGIADQIVAGAPDYCEINIICDGKQMSTGHALDSASALSSPSTMDPTPTFPPPTLDCGCFKI